MNTYTQLVFILVLLTFIPSLYLTYIVRPSRWIWIFRGGEASLTLSLTLLTGLVLLRLTTTFNTIDYPNLYWGTFSLLVLTVISSLVWGRVSQHVRHEIRSRQTVKMGIEQLREAGIDVSAFEKKKSK